MAGMPFIARYDVWRKRIGLLPSFARPLISGLHLGAAGARSHPKASAWYRPLGWEHIAFNGDYVWPTEPLETGFRPLRNPRAEFLSAA